MLEIKFDCPHCGQKLEVDDSYYGRTVACPSCKKEIIIPEEPVPTAKIASIASISPAESRNAPETKPFLTLRPVFIGWVAALSVVPGQLFATVFATAFCGAISDVLAQSLKLHLAPWSTFVFFGCLFFFGTPLVTYIATKRTYAKTEYRFFRNHLEYAEGFWTAENKSIKYNKITETTLRRGIIQRACGLGTIFLATPATASQQGVTVNGVGRSGIRIRDIKDPEKVYETIQRLVNG